MDPKAEKFDISITGIGLNCVTGDQPFALFGAVGTQLTLATPDPVQEAPSLTGDGFEAIVTSPAMDNDEFDPEMRMHALWQPVLAETLESAGIHKGLQRKLRIHLIVPSKESDRGSSIDANAWENEIFINEDLPENSLVSVIYLESCLTKEFINACQSLQSEECDMLVFGVVDSLLDDLTCRQLALSRRLKTVASADGVVPAEAAAFLVLQRTASVDDNTTVHGFISAIATASEPNAGEPDQKPMTGLANAISNTTRIANLDIGDLVMIRGLANEQAGLLEWHQTHNRLWPDCLPEDKRLAMQNGELDAPKIESRTKREILDVSKTVGDTGSAAPVLGIVLACGRFEFGFPSVTQCVVCETGDFPYRGAVAVVAPNSTNAVRSGQAAA